MRNVTTLQTTARNPLIRPLHLRDGAEGWRWWSCGADDWRRE